METVATQPGPALTFEDAERIVALIETAIEARADYERIVAEPSTLEGYPAWSARVEAAAATERAARAAAFAAVRDLARDPR